MTTVLTRQDSVEMRVLSDALLNVCKELDISQTNLSEILGVSQASISRLKATNGQVSLPPKATELSLLLIRIFRSLDSILGNRNYERQWFSSENKALQGRPVELVRTIEGMARVLAYLDANRAGI